MDKSTINHHFQWINPPFLWPFSIAAWKKSCPTEVGPGYCWPGGGLGALRLARHDPGGAVFFTHARLAGRDGLMVI